MLRTTRRKIMLAVCIPVATLVILEIALRILFLPSFAFSHLWLPDPYVGVRMRSGPTTIPIGILRTIFNSRGPEYYFKARISPQGFRSEREYSGAREAGSYRVACLGDSITFGWGLDDQYAYPALLERRLQDRLPGLKVEVLNAGVPGYSSRAGLVLLDREVLPLRPDLVILQYGWNDCSTVPRLYGPLKRLPDKALMVGMPGQWYPMKNYWFAGLLRHTALYSVATVVSVINDRTFGMAAVEGMKSGRTIIGPSGPSYERVSPDDFRRFLTDMIGLCRERRVDAMVVIEWPMLAVYRDQAAAVARQLGVPVVSHYDLMFNAPGLLPGIGKDPAALELLRRGAARYPENVIRDNPRFYFLADPIHPNELFNTIFADRLAAEIGSRLGAPDAAPGNE